MPKIVLATCVEQPQLTLSDQALADALSGLGVEVAAAPWNGAGAEFSDADLVVIRSTWDYHRTPDLFLEWVSRLDPARLVNSPALIRWNIDKTYLTRLEGVRRPPTAIATPSPASIREAMSTLGLSRAVVKPLISASGEGLTIADLSDANSLEAAAAGIASGGLVQPLIEEIRTVGEMSLIFIDGAFTHAVVKKPKSGAILVQAEHGGTTALVEPSSEIRREAERILALLPEQPLFARIDGLALDGGLMLMEVELIEPELFFQFSAAAADRFAAALTRRLD